MPRQIGDGCDDAGRGVSTAGRSAHFIYGPVPDIDDDGGAAVEVGLRAPAASLGPSYEQGSSVVTYPCGSPAYGIMGL